MKKTTLKELKRLVNNGAIIDISNSDFKDIEILQLQGLRVITLSCGTYGMNGALLQDNQGNQYGIIGRTSSLFQVL